MSFAEKVAAAEDAKAGRTIPAWRFSLAQLLVVVCVVAGHHIPSGPWTFVAGFVALILFSLLLSQFKRRQLS